MVLAPRRDQTTHACTSIATSGTGVQTTTRRVKGPRLMNKVGTSNTRNLVMGLKMILGTKIFAPNARARVQWRCVKSPDKLNQLSAC